MKPQELEEKIREIWAKDQLQRYKGVRSWEPLITNVKSLLAKFAEEIISTDLSINDVGIWRTTRERLRSEQRSKVKELLNIK